MKAMTAVFNYLKENEELGQLELLDINDSEVRATDDLRGEGGITTFYDFLHKYTREG